MGSPAIRTHELNMPASSLGEVACGICRRQISRYTCPTCNLPYCSLNCFRSELHSRCSGLFYQKEIETGIKSGSSVTEGDKNKMLELLKRIEDQSAANENDLFNQSDEENKEDNLVHRFSAIDISSASADDLLRLLTNKERDEFFVALKDPSSELARELLESAELRKTRQLPWWEAPSDGSQSPFVSRVPYGMKPDLMTVPTNLVDKTSRGISLLYNICAVFLAYTYVTRHLSMSPLASTTNDSQDRHEARRMIYRSVPFLTDKKSKLRHMSLTDAVLSFWSRLDPGSIDNRAMVVLLEDIAKLVRPRRITVADRSVGGPETTVTLGTDHPSATTIMVISDMNSLFGTCVDSTAIGNRESHVVMKLTFYAAQILSTRPSRLHALADEINLFSKSMAKEAD